MNVTFVGSTDRIWHAERRIWPHRKHRSHHNILQYVPDGQWAEIFLRGGARPWQRGSV